MGLPSTPEEMWATLDWIKGPEAHFFVVENRWGVLMVASWGDKAFYAVIPTASSPGPGLVESLRPSMEAELKDRLWEAIHE